MSSLVRKVARPLIGGALGFLVGGPTGAAYGAGLGAASEALQPPKITGAAGEDRTDAILDQQEADAASERARLLTEQRARQRAARRGGIRSLLSSERLSPETGLQTTLGPG